MKDDLQRIFKDIPDETIILEETSVDTEGNANEVKKIISFVIPRSVTETDVLKEQLKSLLEKALPYYMIPGDIVQINEFPYSTSHKIDKSKLINDYLTQQMGDS